MIRRYFCSNNSICPPCTVLSFASDFRPPWNFHFKLIWLYIKSWPQILVVGSCSHGALGDFFCPQLFFSTVWFLLGCITGRFCSWKPGIQALEDMNEWIPGRGVTFGSVQIFCCRLIRLYVMPGFRRWIHSKWKLTSKRIPKLGGQVEKISLRFVYIL